MGQRAGDRRAPMDSLKERVDELVRTAQRSRRARESTAQAVRLRPGDGPLDGAFRVVRGRVRVRVDRDRDIFTYGSVLNSSGPVGIWTWPIVVVGQLAVALVYGSLAARIPVTGYSYQWMSRLWPTRY